MPSSAHEVATTSSALVRSYSEAIAWRSAQPPVRVGLKLEQRTDRARLAVAARQHEPRAVLIPCVETLNTERAQFHVVQYRARMSGRTPSASISEPCCARGDQGRLRSSRSEER